MNYQQPWQELTVDVSTAVRKDIVLENLLSNSEYASQPGGIWRFGYDTVDQFLSTDWIAQMHNIGILIQTALVFYRTPYYVHPNAHIDIMTTSNKPAIAAINWTMDAQDDSDMIWYNIPPIPPEHATTSADTKYQHWLLDQIAPYEIARKTIGTTPTLVRTGIPHNVETRSRSRWCVSVRCRNIELMSWQDTVDYFKPWIKNVDS